MANGGVARKVKVVGGGVGDVGGLGSVAILCLANEVGILSWY